MYNNLLMSVTADTSQDPIGPCGPLEQSEDSCRHSAMAALSPVLDFGAHPLVALSSVLDFEAHPIVGYYDWGNTVGVRVRVRIMIRFRLSASRVRGGSESG